MRERVEIVVMLRVAELGTRLHEGSDFRVPCGQVHMARLDQGRDEIGARYRLLVHEASVSARLAGHCRPDGAFGQLAKRLGRGRHRFERFLRARRLLRLGVRRDNEGPGRTA